MSDLHLQLFVVVSPDPEIVVHHHLEIREVVLGLGVLLGLRYPCAVQDSEHGVCVGDSIDVLADEIGDEIGQDAGVFADQAEACGGQRPDDGESVPREEEEKSQKHDPGVDDSIERSFHGCELLQRSFVSLVRDNHFEREADAGEQELHPSHSVVGGDRGSDPEHGPNERRSQHHVSRRHVEPDDVMHHHHLKEHDRAGDEP
mmetsp:Transcript_5120/g.10440  ORF Transcript_5120/g.10440 Transcript_5120/m.10440 type:complete len:202 (-) Transcript_5120:312-917(-)